MPTTAPRAKEHQERWQEIVADPTLRELPYKVETNKRGQIILSPHRSAHSYAQGDIIELLSEQGEEGRPFPEFPITTKAGIRVPDVVWVSSARRTEMDQAGDPPTLAPEVCIEVMSEHNDWDEMREKRELFLEAGAEEVWVVTEDGEVRFFAEEEIAESEIVPEFPDHL